MKSVLCTLRALLRQPPPKITRGQAIEIALAELARRDAAPLQMPDARGLLTHESIRVWTVLMDPDFKPCRRVVIDNQTGEVIKYVGFPR